MEQGMTVDRDDVVKILKVISDTYVTFRPMDLTATADVWTTVLKDLNRRAAFESLKRHIQTERFPPTPAEIRSGCVTLSEPRAEDPQAAWDKVWKALFNYNPYDEGSAEREYLRLDEATRRALGTPDSIKELAYMDEERVNTVEKSQFLRDYRAITAEVRKEAMASQDVRATLPEPLPDIELIGAGTEDFAEESRKPMGEGIPQDITEMLESLRREFADTTG